MRKLLTALVAVALAVGLVAAADESPIAGTWQGKTENTPVVTLKIKEDNGKLTGTAIFYKIVDDGGGPQVTGQSSAEMIDPKLEGKIFSFQTRGSKGDLFSYKMELTGKNEGKFTGQTVMADGSEAPAITMVREQ